MLVIELDGSQHVDSESDARRTRWLNECGYAVLRFWNDEVFLERRSVLETILAVLEGKITGSSSGLRFAPAIHSNASPPTRGEGTRSEAEVG
jgi:hypothetical protein